MYLVASVLPLVAASRYVDALTEVSGGILRAMGKQVRALRFVLASFRHMDLLSSPVPWSYA